MYIVLAGFPFYDFLSHPWRLFVFVLWVYIQFYCRTEFVISSTYGYSRDSRRMMMIYQQHCCRNSVTEQISDLHQLWSIILFGRGGCEPNKTWCPQLLLQILGINPGICNNILIKFFVSHVRGCEQNRILMEDAECKRAASNCSSRLNGRRKLWCSCFRCLLCFPHSFPSCHQPRHESWGWNCTLPINQVLHFNLRIIFVWFWSLIS